jgi:hypothetical protein
MDNPTEINICCPFFRTMKCGDTREHRHIRCLNQDEMISNDEAAYYCISDEKFLLCPHYETVRDKKVYNEN